MLLRPTYTVLFSFLRCCSPPFPSQQTEIFACRRISDTIKPPGSPYPSPTLQDARRLPLRLPLPLPLPLLITLTSTAYAYRGDMTYYFPGVGSCGLTSSPNDAIVALASYDA